ncbi:MAG: glycosyltransferase family 2 protein [Actinobacteria bacterium]|nr:glycosyltransferase family 2 protein [Actinomycetota bacterium]
MTCPEVSVVIPTRNRSDLARVAVAAALGQSGVSVEVIVLDDGSTDGTAERLRQIDDARLRVERNDHRRGVAHARNRGIAAARAPWVAFLDDDDLWSPDKLRRQLEAAGAAGFVYAGVVELTEDRRVIREWPLPAASSVATLLLVRQVLPAGSSNVVARTELLRDLGGFDEQLFQLADWDLWIRLAQATPAAACDELLVGYVHHRQSMLVTERANVYDEFRYLRRKHRTLARRHGVDFDEVTFARWVGVGHRVAGIHLAAAAVYLRSGVASRNAGNLLRAVGAVVAAPAMDYVRRRRFADASPPEPGWLAAYL